MARGIGSALGRAGDHADPVVTEGDEVLGDLARAVAVLGQDRVGVDAVVADAGDPAAQGLYGGQFAAQVVLVALVAEATGQQEHATGALCAQPGEVVELQGGVAERVADEYEQSVLVCHAHRADRERREVRSLMSCTINPTTGVVARASAWAGPCEGELSSPRPG